MNKEQAENITNTLQKMAEYETTQDEAVVSDSDYHYFLTDCGFEADDNVGMWLGPDGSGMDDGDEPARQMLAAWTAWQADNKQAPDFACSMCLTELLYARDITDVNFS
jgi:hypothetical protein